MITGVARKTEKQYRALETDSSSSLKDFATDRRKYFKKYLLGEIVEDLDDNQSVKIGNIVDCLKFTPQEWDSKFYMSECQEPPTGLMEEFVKNLVIISKEKSEDGVVTASFEDIMKGAYLRTPFKRDKFETIVTKFVGSDAEKFYREKLRGEGKIIACMQDIDNAQKVIEGLDESPYVGPIINREDGGGIEMFKQLQIEDYELDGLLLKSMLDIVEVDHNEKCVQGYDLKVTYAVEDFYRGYYLKRKAYIQMYVYFKALVTWRDKNFRGYRVGIPQFIVADSINYYAPLIYKLDEQDVINAYEGFEEGGRKYEGVKDVVANLLFAKENDIWNISRINYLNEGIANLRG